MVYAAWNKNNSLDKQDERLNIVDLEGRGGRAGHVSGWAGKPPRPFMNRGRTRENKMVDSFVPSPLRHKFDNGAWRRLSAAAECRVSRSEQIPKRTNRSNCCRMAGRALLLRSHPTGMSTSWAYRSFIKIARKCYREIDGGIRRGWRLCYCFWSCGQYAMDDFSMMSVCDSLSLSYSKKLHSTRCSMAKRPASSWDFFSSMSTSSHSLLWCDVD